MQIQMSQVALENPGTSGQATALQELDALELNAVGGGIGEVGFA